MGRDLLERESDLLQQVAQAVEPHGLQMEVLRRAPLLGKDQADAEIRIRNPAGEVDLLAEIKVRLTPDTFGPAVSRLRRHGSAAVLITDYVSPALADRLREQEVFFLDAAGNAFLSHSGLYVWVTGRRNPIADQQTKERVRAFQPSGLKLIFALLSQPELVEADYRTLAKITDTALGTVHLVLRDLVAENYVHRIGRTRRILLRPKELLDTWVQPFVRDLRPRLLLGRFATSNTDWWQQVDICKYDSLWGGEPAGATLTGFLKPGTLTIYADKLPATLLVHQRLTRDEKGRVEILKKFWSFSESNAAEGLVPPILAYADLLAIGDARTLETAERLFEEHIDGPFQAYLARTAG
jgi:hypothetical protein